MKPRQFSHSIILLLLAAMLTCLSACQLLAGKKGAGKRVQGQTVAAGSQIAKQLLGAWQVSYAVNGEVQSAHMTLTGAPGGFEGTGTDDSNGGNFIIDAGFITGNTIGFHKRYHVEENPNLPPIVYDGTLEVVSNDAYKGPYLHGTYKLEKPDGSPGMQGEWDAQKVEFQQAAQNTLPKQTAAQQEQPAAPAVDPSKPPDLSGKWNSGYEYMFKTFHSKLFIEQDGEKITGHGADTNTNESYTITGTYKFPDVTIIHKYPELKLSKKVKKAPRTLEFRGKIEVVNEPEYQGPRITGKNMGGGDWMAEQVR